MHLKGEANDYLGKGLSGGRVIVETPDGSPFVAMNNVIVGNTLLYGATIGSPSQVRISPRVDQTARSESGCSTEIPR